MVACIWFDGKTCYLTSGPTPGKKTEECLVCILASETADRSDNFTIATSMGPQ